MADVDGLLDRFQTMVEHLTAAAQTADPDARIDLLTRVAAGAVPASPPAPMTAVQSVRFRQLSAQLDTAVSQLRRDLDTQAAGTARLRQAAHYTRPHTA
jgi:hypothetical protein